MREIVSHADEYLDGGSLPGRDEVEEKRAPNGRHWDVRPVCARTLEKGLFAGKRRPMASGAFTSCRRRLDFGECTS